MAVTGGNALAVFNDFIKNTGPAILTSPTQFINEASKRNYMLGRFLRGRDMDEVLQGGSEIRDHIIKDDGGTFTHYRPNAMFTWSNPQVEQTWTTYWRFSLDYMAWTEQQVILNQPSGLTRQSRFHGYKSEKKKIENRMWTSMMNGLEDSLVAVPNPTSMEAEDGDTPNSLLVFNNEETNGLHGSYTTVMKINPVTDTYWKPNTSQYSYTDPNDSNNNGTGLVDAFEDMSVVMRYSPPPEHSDAFTETMLRWFIATSKGGQLLYRRVLRNIGDRGYVSNPQDPAYMEPKFAGIDIEEFDVLEDAALYDDGSSGYTDWANANTVGPRFHIFNTDYMRMVFHAQRYFHRHEIREHPNQVGSWRQPVAIWHNLACRSRRRGCGTIYPGASS